MSRFVRTTIVKAILSILYQYELSHLKLAIENLDLLIKKTRRKRKMNYLREYQKKKRAGVQSNSFPPPQGG
jgi:hypothetical protein